MSNAIISSAYIIGWSFLFTSDFQVAVTAANKISRLLRRQPKIDCEDEGGLTMEENIGNINIRDAEFSYPNRKIRITSKCLNIDQ